MGSRWVDEAFGFMLGWNFVLYELCLIPFEISALSLVLTFWRDDIPSWAVCLACTVLYGILNIFAVRWYGESEFWLASGKVLLIGIVFMFTFVTSKHIPSNLNLEDFSADYEQWLVATRSTMHTDFVIGVSQDPSLNMSPRAAWVNSRGFWELFSKQPSRLSAQSISRWSQARLSTLERQSNLRSKPHTGDTESSSSAVPYVLASLCRITTPA